MSDPVQIATGLFSGSLSATATLNGVGSGHMLICTVAHVDAAGGSPTFTITDGSTYTKDVTQNSSGGASGIVIARRDSVSSGNYTVTVTAQSGLAANSNGQITLSEWGTMLAGGPDQTSSGNGVSTGPMQTGTTAALTGSNDIVIAVLQWGTGDQTGVSQPPSGFTLLGKNHASSYNEDADYKLLSGTTAGQTVNWGTCGTSNKWACGLAAYQTITGVVFRKTLSSIGTRVGARQLQS